MHFLSFTIKQAVQSKLGLQFNFTVREPVLFHVTTTTSRNVQYVFSVAAGPGVRVCLHGGVKTTSSCKVRTQNTLAGDDVEG